MSKPVSRRDFLKLGGLGLSSLAFSQLFPEDQDGRFETIPYGRVANAQVSVYSRPRDDARIVRQRYRDELLAIYYELTPPTGPAWNPLWYRVWGGYVHSAHIQNVRVRHNPIIETIREGGQISEITVPFSQAFGYSRIYGWEPLNRLYHGTTHWVTGVGEGPTGDPWYIITDELTSANYHAPGHHLRLIPDEELTPISPEVPFEKKWIGISLAKQTLTAYERGEPMLHTKISSGISSQTTINGIPTQTPIGTFNISNKLPSKHMGRGRLTDNLEDYILLGVPWTAFFHEYGYAIHGTYWHNNFGVPMSRGCVNMPNQAAKWLFRWMTPVNEPGDINKRGFGTQVRIF